MNRARDVVDIEQVFGVSTAPDRAESRPDARHRRESESVLSVVRHVNADARLCERQRGQRFDGASPFRSRAAQELEARRHVVEQLATPRLSFRDVERFAPAGRSARR